VKVVRRLPPLLQAEGYSPDWCQAIWAYSALANDRMADFGSSITSWTLLRETIRGTFGRFALPIVWDFTEVNPFSGSTGDYGGAVEWIPSTYVVLVGGLIALLMCLIMGLFAHEAPRQGHQVKDVTFYVAAAILYGGCVVWSYLYNWRTTGSAILSVSLTLLQTVSAAFVIVALYLWIGGRNTKRYEQEHGIS
jgi:hypothetical protein